MNTHRFPRRPGHIIAALATFFVCALAGAVAVPSPEQLLPDDTLVMITVPDVARLKEAFRQSSQGAFWNDEAMKPFKENFLTKWKEQFIQPLERELDVELGSYASLPQGQLTVAVTQNSAAGHEDQPPGLLLLLDTREKGGLLRTNLAELHKKWAAAGKPIRTEKIRNLDFSVLPVSSNDVPGTLKKFFTPTAQLQEPPADGEAPKAPPRSEWVIGQSDSLLIVGNSQSVVEKIVARLSGGSVPALGDLAAYDANHQALFRDAPFYGWVNAKALFDSHLRAAAKRKAAPEDPLVPFDSDKLLGALGLSGLKTVAFALQNGNDGWLFRLFVGVPESGRAGVFAFLPGEAKECSPPPFVPAGAVKFQRWRIDGQKAWAGLVKMLGDISPQSISGLNFILDTANLAAREKDPDFDVRKNLIGNLGDDIISYEKAARTGAGSDSSPPAALYLLGSPNSEQLAASLKSVLVIFNPQAGAPVEREFLGRKIFSVPFPSMSMLPMAAVAKPSAPLTLNYAAGAGYVALSADASLLEEYLRSSENQGKALRETPGFTDAMGKVITPGTSLFGYENQAETMRAAFETMKATPSGMPGVGLTALSAPLSSLVGQSFNPQDLMDFSLLPRFDKVAKYFSFTVHALNANVDGLTFTMFTPAPLALKADLAAKLSAGPVLATPASPPTNGPVLKP
jgi:hypothetical protein